MRYLMILTSILAITISGCATSGLSGTTDLKAKYDSSVDASGADRTIVDIQAKGKAGDVLEAVTNASLMTKDGTGAERNMSFGANQKNDASQRDDAIVQGMQIGMQAFSQGMAAGQAIAGQFIPVWGAVKQSGQAADVAKQQAQMQALQQMFQAFAQYQAQQPSVLP